LKYLKCQKKALLVEKFGSMSELRPISHFLLKTAGDRQTSTLFGVQKIEQNLQREGKYLENEDASLFCNQSFTQTCNVLIIIKYLM
jgi:hypothetical protein